MALDFFAGCVGGCAGVIVGHPLDTVKIHLQTQNKHRGTYDCLRRLVTTEGVHGLYKGMSSPLLAVAAINAIVFGVYGNTQKLFTADPQSLYSHCIAGSAAGLIQSFFCSPMELAKSRVQLSTSKITPIECLRKIYKSEGARGIFRGLNLTIVREVPGYASYFVAYEWLQRFSDRDKSSTMIGTGEMMMAGGLAGCISWVVVYPIDVIKTRVQCDTIGRYKGAIDCFKSSIAAGEGYRFLFRGLWPTLIRAFPVNAATFTVVAWTMRLFDKNNCNSENNNNDMWGKYSDAAAVYTLKVSEAAPV